MREKDSEKEKERLYERDRDSEKETKRLCVERERDLERVRER